MRPPLCKLLALVTLSLASVSSPVTAGGQQALRTQDTARQIEPKQSDPDRPVGQVQGWGQSGADPQAIIRLIRRDPHNLAPA